VTLQKEYQPQAVLVLLFSATGGGFGYRRLQNLCSVRVLIWKVRQVVSLCKLCSKRTMVSTFHIWKVMPSSVAKILQDPVFVPVNTITLPLFTRSLQCAVMGFPHRACMLWEVGVVAPFGQLPFIGASLWWEWLLSGCSPLLCGSFGFVCRFLWCGGPTVLIVPDSVDSSYRGRGGGHCGYFSIFGVTLPLPS
jgi:hypothetical protein